METTKKVEEFTLLSELEKMEVMGGTTAQDTKLTIPDCKKICKPGFDAN